MKDAYYFSHDSNASSDPKISAMINQYGIEGYGRFWIVVEMLREQQDYRLPLKNYIFDALAMRLQCAAEEAEKYITDCINLFELFDSDEEFFWSNSLIRRMKQKEDRSMQASEAAKKRWGKSKRNADAMQTQSGSNASKVKESKVYKDLNNNNDHDHAADEKPAEVEPEKETITPPKPANTIKSFEQEFGRPLSPLEYEQIVQWEKDMPLPLVEEALKRAVLMGKRNFKYINSILNEWRVNNIMTIIQVQEYDEKFKARRGGGNNSRGDPPVRKTTPLERLEEWAKDDQTRSRETG